MESWAQITFGATVRKKTTDVDLYVFDVPNMHHNCADLRYNYGCKPPPRVTNQGVEGTCSAHASLGAFGCALSRYHVDLIEFDADYTFDTSVSILSNKIGGKTMSDKNVDVKEGMESLTFGALPMHTKGDMVQKYNEASKRVVVEYVILAPHVDNLKNCILNGYPFAFSFNMTTDMMYWMSGKNKHGNTDKNVFINANYIIPDPIKTQEIVAAHAVLCLGFDESIDCFLIRNSYGEQFGDRGHFWMSEYLISLPKYMHDFYFVKEVCVTSEPMVCNKKTPTWITGSSIKLTDII